MQQLCTKASEMFELPVAIAERLTVSHEPTVQGKFLFDKWRRKHKLPPDGLLGHHVNFALHLPSLSIYSIA